MEETKKQILEILQGNSRLQPAQIAAMLNIETAQVEKLIKELEDEKIIVKYHTIINWEKVTDDKVTAFIEVRVTPERGVGFDTVAERIYRFPEVKTVYLMSGGFDLAVLIEGKTMKEVALFVATKLATLDHVQSTATHFVLKTYKQQGVIFEDKEADRRLVISP
ncbi:Lrp/AsnC family transcriptional regulator [Thermincola potens]|uniref:Transcriptional regulator, AsnC family n=1 Tax=Thermincola potens (strain JR) TaxID=635013 RepID=D5XDL7_THEPJ|nr:Lrp/AsnC family transcriptional regulator [Thermincola potens]ADG83763.1 transcriptional regulator, AsnC family [Thermincola potens JR]